jgi:hypothetical protein
MLVGDNRVITIKLKDVKAKTYENNIPTWVCPYRHFLLSSVNSWNDVNAWAENVFALEEDPQLEDVFNEIFTGSETKNEKINKIINFVQDDIRYMGIESGLGSIKPFPPEQVVKQRFGDCKDKSLLLVSLLKKIGIENAYPALVNTYYKQSVDHYLPNNELFNHCIVNFEDNGSSYWVDPSIALQGGDYKDLFITNYGKALIVGKPTDTLQLIDQKEPKSLNKIIEDFNSESFTKPAQLKISSKKSGFEADNRRQFLEFYSINKLSDYVSDDLKTQFPTVNKTTEIEILDDFENNEFETIYNFDLDGFWQDGDKSSNKSAKGYWIFNYTPSSISYYISSSACNEREFDYEIIYPLNFEYQLTFHFPATLIIDDQNKRIDNEVFYYEETIEQINANSVKINYAFSTKKNHIAVDEYKDICEQINDIAKGLPLTFYFPK